MNLAFTQKLNELGSLEGLLTQIQGESPKIKEDKIQKPINVAPG